METKELLDAVSRIAEEEWATKRLPVLLATFPQKLKGALPDDNYKDVLGEQSLKSFLQANSLLAGITVVQDPAHPARVGFIPVGQSYVFPSSPTSGLGITSADAQAFARVLNEMTLEEKRSVVFPAGFVSRLLAAR